MTQKMIKGRLSTLTYSQAKEFLLPRHYSGRIPSISYAYGWYLGCELVAVCTFGKPASPTLCVGVCGEEFSGMVYELNRLCRIENLKSPLSSFVSACLKDISQEGLIVVSYSDTAMGHHGYIYQACNFIYTGATKRRTDKYTPDNKHSRHYVNKDQHGKRKVRSAKHRYVYFAIKNRNLRRKIRATLKYPILPYPKGDNKNYILGEYLKPEIVIDGRMV